MADKKITQLTNITGANLVDADEFVVVDISADETKAITLGELKEAFDSGSGFVRITGDTMTGALDVQSTITADGLTVDGDARLDGGSSGSDTYLRFTEFFAAIQNAGFYLHLDGADDDLYIGRHDTADTNVANDKPVIGIDRGTGDISFYEDTGTTPKFFWDASAESLGIGTSSPRTALDVTGRTTTDNATVGSGTASTYVDLTINGASTANYGPMIELQSAGTPFGKISNYGRVQGGTSTDMFVTTSTTNNLLLGTNNTERMRIDSSGNLLVGGTSAYGTSTFTVGADGDIKASSSSRSAIFNSTTSGYNGTLVEFRVADLKVGSIGVEGGDLTIGDAGAGLQFRGIDPCIRPHNMTTNSPSDNTVDLGRSNTRFKDLYLSGGVYLGGTGSDNKLDDYETGNFTPSWTNASSATYNTQIGKYTKVGNVVFYYIRLDSSSLTFTSAPAIQGLPFTSNSTPNLYSNAYTFPTFGFENFGDGGIIGQIPFNDTKVQLYYLTNGSGGNYNVVDASSMSEGTQVIINVSGHYYV